MQKQSKTCNNVRFGLFFCSGGRFHPEHYLAANNDTGIMVNKNSPHKELLGPLIEWITLDCSETGL
jgi:hypothetical protein